MSTKPMLTAVEHYLDTELELQKKAHCMSESAAKEACLDDAKKELEKQAGGAHSKAGIRRILVAIDHERHAAITTAISIAQPLHAQIAIIYVLEPLPGPNFEMSYDLTQAYKEERSSASTMLARVEKEVPANALAFTLLRDGHAADEIVRAAKDFKADLIVMGTHRRGVLARFFMGSTSQAVLHKAHCPVMFVTDATVAPAEPKALQAT